MTIRSGLPSGHIFWGMPSEPGKAGAPRRETDKSVHQERARTDQAIQQQVTSAQTAEKSDSSAERRRTDVQTRSERDHADESLASDQTEAERSALARQREVQDEALRQERSRTDARNEQERLIRKEVTLRLFDKEREATDRHLLAERVWADEALALRFHFLGMLGHDLRSMLAGIDLQAFAMIRHAASEGPRSQEAGQRLQKIVRRMERLVTDLVDASSLEAGRLKVYLAPASLADAVAEIAEEFQTTAQAQKVVLDVEVEGAPLSGIFDYGRLLQVLANLVGNAVKFTPVGGRVTIRAGREAAGFRVSVQDTGQGIPADEVDTVFERFTQLAAAKQGGAGLGLYIARSIIDAHGGRIWVESAPGKGSTFVFTLPAEGPSTEN
jgi:signal transduction histidine kinase